MTGPLLASVVLTLAASGAAAALAQRLRLPGGVVLWAIAAAAALHLAHGQLPPLPEALRVAAQILIGITIGVGIRRGPLAALRAVRWQLALTMSLLLGASTLAGLVLALRTPLDGATALLATGPGGASDMAVAAVQLEVDAALVAGLQVVRQLLVFGLVPLLFGLVPLRPSERPSLPED